MKIIICGGRDMDHASAFNLIERRLMDELHFCAPNKGSIKITKVINGGCRGADEAAGDWAKSEHIPVEVCRADWKTHGKAAGPIRNREMLEKHRPDYVVALPGGKGTANMIALAESSGVPVIRLAE